MTRIARHWTVAALMLGMATAAAAQGTADLRVELTARAIQPGEVVLVSVVCTCADSPPRATAFDTEVPLSRSADGTRWEGLVGIDLAVTAGAYSLTVRQSPSGAVHEAPLQVVRKSFATRTLRVAPEYVEPPPEVLARILREAAQLEALLKTVTPPRWSGPVGLPLPTSPAKNFGARSVFNGEARNPHAGIDFGSPTGALIASPTAGTVVLAEDLYFTGNTVIVDHGAGLYSLMAHLSSMAVAAGDVVTAGTTLGRVGATGRVTGPHLHWGVRLRGARVDPLSLIDATKGLGTAVSAR